LIPEPEAPGRLVKQLALLGQALAAVRGEPQVGAGDYVTVCQVAQDTLPTQRRVVIEALLAPASLPPTTTDIAEATRYPTPSARRYLQELNAVRLVERLPEGQGRPDRWTASDTLRELLKAMRAPLMVPSTEGGSVRGGVVSE
jgi:hypothetical protein